MVIPVSAIAQRGGDETLFVVKDGVASARTVRLGPRNASEVLVLSGLAVGETVATSGAAGLQDGDRVSRRAARTAGRGCRDEMDFRREAGLALALAIFLIGAGAAGGRPI